MDPRSESDHKSEGKAALLAFFLGAVALFLEFYDAKVRSGSVSVGSDIDYIQHKAHTTIYVLGDIFWILAALLFAQAILSYAWKHRSENHVSIRSLAALIAGFFIFVIGKTVHMAPSFFLKEMEPQISVITGAIFSDLKMLYHIVMSLNMVSFLLIGLAFIFIGHAFMQSNKLDKMLGFFMEVAGVFALATVAIYISRSWDALYGLNYVGLVGNATYNLFYFLLLLTFYKWGTFLIGIKLNILDIKGGFDGKEES